mmetsp:Transcript_11665/g.34701  ORF Transcript_11665/g.34701 Transcript_11665/m.34701 type:complete len:210 (+) Transcript_11665:122-751(+)
MPSGSSVGGEGGGRGGAGIGSGRPVSSNACASELGAPCKVQHRTTGCWKSRLNCSICSVRYFVCVPRTDSSARQFVTNSRICSSLTTSQSSAVGSYWSPAWPPASCVHATTKAASCVALLKGTRSKIMAISSRAAHLTAVDALFALSAALCSSMTSLLTNWKCMRFHPISTPSRSSLIRSSSAWAWDFCRGAYIVSKPAALRPGSQKPW